MSNTENLQSNYTLLKLIKTGISPLSTMIGTSAYYYCQLIGNPILGSINALLFLKKLGINIWNLNQRPSSKTKLLNSSKKILLGSWIIGIVNYYKFNNSSINPNPSPTPIITTTVDPFPPDLLLNTNNNIFDNNFMDWYTYISLNAYGIANFVAGITELIPSKFKNLLEK